MANGMFEKEMARNGKKKKRRKGIVQRIVEKSPHLYMIDKRNRERQKRLAQP